MRYVYIEREDRLEEIFTISPSIKLPYEALSSFYEVENSSASDRHQLLLDWIKTYIKCDYPPVKQAASSIDKRHSAIERA
ncbi:MAG: transposase [Lachnospiraceae bacterium]|nr:transposase [Lachnospiraceae bacterium]